MSRYRISVLKLFDEHLIGYPPVKTFRRIFTRHKKASHLQLGLAFRYLVFLDSITDYSVGACSLESDSAHSSLLN